MISHESIQDVIICEIYICKYWHTFEINYYYIQVKNILPVSILHKLYFALIHPHISYGILSWGNAGKTVLQKTTTLQKRAIRMINKKSYNSHTDPLFRSSKILKIQDLYNYQSAIFMFDYTRKKLPNSFDSVFPYNHEIQSLRFTRQSRLLHIPRCVSNFASKLPLYMLPSIWNKWASHLSENTTRNQLKKHVKSTLTEHYSSNVYCSNTFCTDCRKWFIYIHMYYVYIYIYIYVNVYVLVFDLFVSPYWFYEYVLKPEIPPHHRSSKQQFV